jgi:hypothetical protein
MKKWAILAAILVLSGTALSGQEQYGNIRGVVVDDQGNPLPGATVSLESDLFPSQSLTCSEAGIFRFINVTPGNYKLRCELAGFKTHVHEVVDLRAGNNFDLRITMTPTTVEEQVTVVATSPIVDTKRTGTVTNVTQDMLQKLPSARDPWVILQQVPGILVNQENVGGSTSGTQSLPVGRGGMTWNAEWIMDGVPITDVVAFSSPGYYDFDTFEEMTISTSGQDATLQTGGVAINIVTKRGGNKFQAQGRTYFTNDDLQADNRTQEVKDLDYVGDQIRRIMDYGLQVGGPVKRDRLWFWLGYGVQDIRLLTINDDPLDTKLKGFNAKLNFRLSSKNRAEFAFLNNKKYAWARGAGPRNPPETTVDQTSNHLYYKLEDEHIFSDNFLVSAKVSYWHGWFEFWPEGGMDTQVGYDLYTGVYSGSGQYQYHKRPAFLASIQGNLFKERFLGGGHELRFGAEFRLTPGEAVQEYAGDTVKYYNNGVPWWGSVNRKGITKFGSNRLSFFVNDAWSIGRLTLNLGLRLDREDCTNYDASVPASLIAPDLLPAVTYPGFDPGVTFLTLSPRLGFTYDLTGDGKTILRGGIARYGAQEGTYVATTITTSGPAGARYWWDDLNGDDRVSTDELEGYPLDGIIYSYGFDPDDPTNFEPINGADPNLKVELSDELLLGVERELFADFSLGGMVILRRNHRFMQYAYYDKASGTVIRESDYIGPVAGSLTYGDTTYDYEYWTLASRKPNGIYLTQAPGSHQNFTALELSAVKRLSHKWMMNASFTYQVFKNYLATMTFFDPTNAAINMGTVPWGTSFPNSNWMAKLSFLYQLPWGINLSGFANARQGYTNVQQINAPTPDRATVGLGGSMNILVEKPGTTRLPNFYNVDLGLTKDISFKNAGKLTLCVDAFNIFNFALALSRFNIVNSSRHDEIQKILNPRVIRFGVKYNF